MTRSAVPERPQAAQAPERLGALGRCGVVMARHHRLVIGLWLVLVAVCAAAFPALHDRLGAPDYTIAGSDSSRVEQLVAEHFSQFGAEQDLIVFHSAQYTADSPEFRAAVDSALTAARGTEGVAGAIGPFEGNAALQISADRHTAFGIVGLDGSMSDRVAVADRLQQALAATDSGVSAAATGFSAIQSDLMQTETADMQRGESIGLPIAAVVLVLALGAVLAATIPMAVTVAGLAVAIGLLFGLTAFLTFDSLVLSIATMICTGAAIDYGMFLVSRFNEELTRRGVRDRKARTEIHAAVGTTMNTTGRTILVSGLIVMISLCALVTVGIPMLNGIAIGVVTAAVATLTAAFTLLPAILAALGPAINRGALPARWRPAETQPATVSSGWTRWAHTVMGRPVLFGGLGVLLLVLAALPIGGIRYGIDMGLGSLADRPSGQATQLVRDNFGPGLLSPIQVVVTGPEDTPLSGNGFVEANRFVAELSRDPRIAQVVPQQLDGRMLAMVIPKDSFDSTAAADLTADIRSTASGVESAEVSVGGVPASFADISERITDRFPWVIALVLAVSLIFLVFAFRSIVLALKAIVMNLLATGAALGLTVAVFQHGVGGSLLGIHSSGFLQVYLPMLVFAVLFGLSMDYEVFLVRRMKEAWDRDPDNAAAVAEGLQRTARPITAAAAIMVAVFASFLTADVLELKQIGFALGVAVAIDAIIVRLILVPAFMQLFGRWNWWLPKLGARRTQPTMAVSAATTDSSTSP
ncbi:MMPL family transporter [Nocardia huaxiensis]|uniref:MMPL family transporter n=1 Tax=Nocardia huaxiensis TaxID=2755382 RepID=UPI001E65813B|nr:MMPL family transporter [Nocardia huaxiensis]UFS99294.1 MMPL family transporter [Nocardia huaxiensis]